tara:strand:+ start:24 stop:224 length:201 start_codon:yes stop_codon:yes gene_type:complete
LVAAVVLDITKEKMVVLAVEANPAEVVDQQPKGTLEAAQVLVMMGPLGTVEEALMTKVVAEAAQVP